MKIAIACGGSGGHVFPGLTTARVLNSQGHEVVAVMSGRNTEEKNLSLWTGKIIKIQTKVPRWTNPVSMLQSAVSIMSAVVVSIKEFKKYKPDVLLAMGSYTSVGPVLAARMLRIPIVLHDSNVVPGKAVIALSRFADKVCISFQEAARHIKHSKVELTGMPIRTDLFEKTYTEKKRDDKFTILVMGVSQGASAINKLAVETFNILSKYHNESEKIQIIHLTGTKEENEIREQYKSIHIAAEVTGFSNDMGRLYSSADFCISRAGASSFFELCYFGLPALFIPLPGLANDHQTANAEYINKITSCDYMKQSEITPPFLANYILKIQNDTEKLNLSKSLLLQNANPHAAEKLARSVLGVVTDRGQ